MPTNDALLRIDGLNVAYGDVQVLWDVGLEIRAGEVVALVGSNGAGKSTLLSTISGLLRPMSGSITVEGLEISGAPTQRIVDLGIAHVPEGRQLFPAITVRDHLYLGAFRRHDRDGIEQDIERVYRLFPRVRERARAIASTLSGGEQQMVAIGRALMARPRLLMIDELSLGLAPILVESLMDVIGELGREGLTVLMVEQDVQAALERSSRAYVLETGHIVLSGDAPSVLADERVRQAYLGV